MLSCTGLSQGRTASPGNPRYRPFPRRRARPGPRSGRPLSTGQRYPSARRKRCRRFRSWAPGRGPAPRRSCARRPGRRTRLPAATSRPYSQRRRWRSLRRSSRERRRSRRDRWRRAPGTCPGSGRTGTGSPHCRRRYWKPARYRRRPGCQLWKAPWRPYRARRRPACWNCRRYRRPLPLYTNTPGWAARRNSRPSPGRRKLR